MTSNLCAFNYKLSNSISVLLPTQNILVQAKRFRGKINLKRPIIHYKRALFEAVTRPQYERTPTTVKCYEKQLAKLNRNSTVRELHPYQKIVAREIRERFEASQMTIICHQNSITQPELFKHRVTLHKAGIEYKSYGRTQTQIAIGDSRFGGVLPLFNLTHATCVLFSSEIQLAKLFTILKKAPTIIPLGGIVYDRLLSRNDLERLAKMPDLQMVRAQFAASLFGAGNQVVQQLQQHQTNLCSLLDSRAELLKDSVGATQLSSSSSDSDSESSSDSSSDSDTEKK